MSCCCCEGPCRELPEGGRKRERLVTEEEAGGEEEPSRTMDISLLRARYRSSRDRRSKQTQVLLFRTVSEELSEAVSIVPVTQSLTPPNITFDPMTYDPWRVHLDVRQHSHTIVPVQLPVSSSEANTSIDGSSRRSSSSSSGAGSFHQESSSRELDPAPDSLSSCRVMSPCSSSSTKLEDPSFEPSTGVSVSCSKLDPVQISLADCLSPSKQRSREGPPDGSLTSAPSSQSSSNESSKPVASTTNLHEGLDEAWSSSGSPTRRRSRRFSTLANRFTRHLSVGKEGLATGVQQNQNYYPFPSRKTPRISEAARRLGMYSSF